MKYSPELIEKGEQEFEQELSERKSLLDFFYNHFWMQELTFFNIR